LKQLPREIIYIKLSDMYETPSLESICHVDIGAWWSLQVLWPCTDLLIGDRKNVGKS